VNNEADYDSQAADYDKCRFTDDMGHHLDFIHKKILNELINPTSKRLLEGGVGTGRFATWLSKKGFKVIGIDLSREMLKKVKEKKMLLNVDVGLVLADIRFLPFRNNLFDGCICINVMDHFSDRDAFFNQVQEVVKPQGDFVFNFSNSQSPYLPIAAVVNLREHALFKSNIFTRWLTLKEVSSSLLAANFNIKSVRGCMIASPMPFGTKLTCIFRSINLISEQSLLRFFSGSIFVKAEIKIR
jgi:ubiquinone/menaquinone biosynthesis C-methylase UbiE